jgi:hypothetical protein
MAPLQQLRPVYRPIAARRRWAWPDDPALIVALGLFWAVSLVRVVAAVVRRETFDGEATLALMAVVALPWVLARR